MVMLLIAMVIAQFSTTTAFSHSRLAPVRLQRSGSAMLRPNAANTALRASNSNDNENEEDWLEGASVGRGSGRSLKKPIEQQSIEELVEQAAREQREESEAEKEAATEKKREVLKRRSDKEYEAYWQRQNKPPPGSEKAMLRAYYSLQKNESLSDKVQLCSSSSLFP